MATFCKVFFKN